MYIDNNGNLTNSETDAQKFLVLQPAVATLLSGTVDGPSVPDGHQILLNGTTVTFSGTGGANATIAQMTSTINAGTSTHKVDASTVPTSTIANSDASGTAYGLVGGYTPFSANIHAGISNTTVSFTTNTAGQAAYGAAVAIPEDMAADINAAGIPTLTATFTSSQLTLTESNGTGNGVIGTPLIKGEVEPHSHQLLYLNNRGAIERSATQSEDIKIIIQL